MRLLPNSHQTSCQEHTGAVALMNSSVPEHGNYKGVRKGSGEEHQEEMQSFFRGYQLFLEIPRPLSQGFLLFWAAQKSSGFDWQRGFLSCWQTACEGRSQTQGFSRNLSEVPGGLTKWARLLRSSKHVEFPNTQLEFAPHLRQQVKPASGGHFPRGSLASCRLFSSCRQLARIQPSAQPPLCGTQAAALTLHVKVAESRSCCRLPFSGAGTGQRCRTGSCSQHR